MYAYLHMYMYMYAYLHMYMYMYAYLYIYMYMYIYVYIHTTGVQYTGIDIVQAVVAENSRALQNVSGVCAQMEEGGGEEIQSACSRQPASAGMISKEERVGGRMREKGSERAGGRGRMREKEGGKERERKV